MTSSKCNTGSILDTTKWCWKNIAHTVFLEDHFEKKSQPVKCQWKASAPSLQLLAQNVHHPPIRAAVVWRHYFAWWIIKSTCFPPSPQLSLAATGPVILCSPVFWGEYVAAGFLSMYIKAPMPWLMQYLCFHMPFSEVWGPEQLFCKVSERKIIASCLFLRSGKAMSGCWGMWQNKHWWSNFSGSK